MVIDFALKSLFNNRTVCCDRNVAAPAANPDHHGCQLLTSRDNFDNPGDWESHRGMTFGNEWVFKNKPFVDSPIVGLVCADGENGWQLLVNRGDVSNPGSYERHLPELISGGAWAIKALGNGKYWRVRDDETIFADADVIDERCVFQSSRNFTTANKILRTRGSMLRWYGDFLACRIPSIPDPKGQSTLLMFGWPEKFNEFIDRHKTAGYNKILLYVCNGEDFGGAKSFNGYDRPQEFYRFLENICSQGMEPAIMAMPDDSPAIWNPYHDPNFGRLMDKFEAFFPQAMQYVTGIMPALEANENNTNNRGAPNLSPKQQFDILRLLLQIAHNHDAVDSVPVWQHWTAGRCSAWPVKSFKASNPRSFDSGKSDPDWWKLIRPGCLPGVRYGVAGMLYQYDGAERNRMGSGGSDEPSIAERTHALAGRLHGDLRNWGLNRGDGFHFIGGEYGYPGDGVSEDEAKARGNQALKYGADGAANGCSIIR